MTPRERKEAERARWLIFGPGHMSKEDAALVLTSERPHGSSMVTPEEAGSLAKTGQDIFMGRV